MMASDLILTHDPREFVRGLQQILISDSKRIGFLCGAGTSIAVKNDGNPNSKVPGVKEMTDKIVNSITDEKFLKALKQVEEDFKEAKTEYLIEYILSYLSQKESVVGKETLCGLNKDEFAKLRVFIEDKIKEIVSVHKKKSDYIDSLLHCDFAQWILHASRKHPIEIFTTNYDYLFEMGLEYHSVPYFDGFVGAFEPFFSTASVADIKFLPEYTKLWKLHGSLGWDYDDKMKRIIRRHQDSSTIIVFPSLLKYDHSKKQPYVSFMDRLTSFIHKDDGILFICGYSFGDQHINDVILNALSKTRTSHVAAFYFDDFTKNSPVAKLAMNEPKLTIYGKRNAVIGGKFGSWRLKTEPEKDDSIHISLYFDEDAALPDQKWTGQGDFKLQKFEDFVIFLISLNYDNYIIPRNKHE